MGSLEEKAKMLKSININYDESFVVNIKKGGIIVARNVLSLGSLQINFDKQHSKVQFIVQDLKDGG